MSRKGLFCSPNTSNACGEDDASMKLTVLAQILESISVVEVLSWEAVAQGQRRADSLAFLQKLCTKEACDPHNPGMGILTTSPTTGTRGEET